MFTIKYKDPFTGLPHLVSSEEVIVKQGDGEKEFVLSVYVPRSKMYVNITIGDKGTIEIILKHLYEKNKFDFYDYDYPVEIAFKESKPKIPEVEMYAVNLGTLLEPDDTEDFDNNGPEGSIDFEKYGSLFDVFFSGTDQDIPYYDPDEDDYD